MSNQTQGSASDRISAILDENSFVEIGAAVKARSTDFNMSDKAALADGVITGYGAVEGIPVYIYSQDASVMNGSIGEMHAKKIVNLYDKAVKTGSLWQMRRWTGCYGCDVRFYIYGKGQCQIICKQP